jgi:hypothetical protein
MNFGQGEAMNCPYRDVYCSGGQKLRDICATCQRDRYANALCGFAWGIGRVLAEGEQFAATRYVRGEDDSNYWGGRYEAVLRLAERIERLINEKT